MSDNGIESATNAEEELLSSASQQQLSIKTQPLYHGEQLLTFFRRPCFTSDGAWLISPAGVIKDSNGYAIECAHVYARGCLTWYDHFQILMFMIDLI